MWVWVVWGGSLGGVTASGGFFYGARRSLGTRPRPRVGPHRIATFRGRHLRVHRYLTHAVVLAIAVAISSYASMDRHVPAYLTSRLGTVDAQAVVATEGGTAGDVSLGRYSTIIKPVAIPTAAPMSHKSFRYTVQAGESPATIAGKFHVSVSQIRRA